MKTILLTAAAILTLTLNSKADDCKMIGKCSAEVSANVPASTIFAGNPDEAAPAELKALLAYPSLVPVAPMILGNPDESAPAELKNVAAYPAKLPLMPLVIGSPDDEAPLELSNMPAYAAN